MRLLLASTALVARTALAIAGTILTPAGHAQAATAPAYPVQAGCAVPPAAIAGPNLTATSAATLSAAIASAMGGGTITLASGNYGDVSLVGLANTGWLKIVAGAGQTPVFTTLVLNHNSDLIFDGITAQSLDNTGDHNGYALVNVSDGGAAATTHDIVLANMTVNSLPALTGLTQAQLASELRVAGFYIVGTAGANTTCISVSGNHVQNVHNGIMLAANSSLVTNNQIDHFSNNGIPFAANDLTITHNNIHDIFNTGDNGATTLPGASGTNGGASGIEGWSGPLAPGVVFNQFLNIMIDSNTVIRQLDPALPFTAFTTSASTPTGSPQGITGWIAGDWSNVTITNNVVITQDSCNGIRWASIHNSKIANNTVAEEQDGTDLAGCPSVGIEIGGTTQGGLASSNTRVVANLAPRIQTDDAAVTADNNIAVGNYDIQKKMIPVQINGVRFNSGNPPFNDAADGSSQPMVSNWVAFWPLSSAASSSGPIGINADLPFTYDLHVASTSFALDSFAVSLPGVSPATDIQGVPRFGNGTTVCTLPVPGAYAYVYAPPCN